MLCRLLPIFLSVWAVSAKGAPAIQPSPEKILFPCQLYANTEVNIMLEIAEELRDRGHECTFLLIDAFQEKIESRGFKFIGFPDPLAAANVDFVGILHELLAQDNWKSYTDHFYKLPEALGHGYEPALKVLQEQLDQETPDVIVASMFADYAFDLAKHRYIPLAVVYACALGNLYFYEVDSATPDSFLWQYRSEVSNLGMRLRHFYRFARFLAGVISSGFGAKTNAVRTQYGLANYDDPLTVLDTAAMIVSLPFGFDVPRKLRPLTHVVGFIPTPFNKSAVSKSDQPIVSYLDNHSGGVIYAAFGSMALFGQDWFDEICQGLDEWTKLAPDRGAIFALTPQAFDRLDKSKVPGSVSVQGWVN
jgi:hypothetical protein